MYIQASSGWQRTAIDAPRRFVRRNTLSIRLGKSEFKHAKPDPRHGASTVVHCQSPESLLSYISCIIVIIVTVTVIVIIIIIIIIPVIVTAAAAAAAGRYPWPRPALCLSSRSCSHVHYKSYAIIYQQKGFWATQPLEEIL